MFEAEQDGAITEAELAVILKTALGVAELSVSRLFVALDPTDTGKITFGNGERYPKMSRMAHSNSICRKKNIFKPLKYLVLKH